MRDASGVHNESTFAFTDLNGDRFLPFGFYQYTVDKPLDVLLPGEEAIHGMTLTSPYASTSSPDDAWFAAMDSFLDLAAGAGFRVNFQLIGFENRPNDAATLANLTKQINHFKDHPAVMAWYLADEPGGQGIANTTLLPKYDAIRAADPSGRPVSMVFCTTQAADYLQMLDIIMVDPYPVPGSSAATVAGALDNVAALGKPVMMVPQAFGGGENWARGPSRQEERLMTYLGLLSGAVAIQYFVRSPEAGFPYAPAAWGEIRMMADEVRVLTPALLGGSIASLTLRDAAGTVKAGAWLDRDGSTVIVAANTANADGLPNTVEFKAATSIAGGGVGVSGAGDDGVPHGGDPGHAAGTVSSRGPCTVTSMFENRYISTSVTAAPDGSVTFSDALRGFATAAYRVECPETSPVPAAPPKAVTSATVTATNASAGAMSLVYNGGFETAVNPAVPDGNYVTLPADQTKGGFFFADYRDSVAGRASLRLTSPLPGGGVTLAPYTIPRVQAHHVYMFSVWTRGTGTVHFALSNSIFTVATASAAGGQATSSDNVVVVKAMPRWAQTTVKLVSTSDPVTACPYGCRSWLSYGLAGRGDALLDELSLVAQ